MFSLHIRWATTESNISQTPDLSFEMPAITADAAYDAQLREAGIAQLLASIQLVMQTLFFGSVLCKLFRYCDIHCPIGIYTVLMGYLTHKMRYVLAVRLRGRQADQNDRKQGLNSRIRRILFYTVLSMFGLSTLYWAVTVAGFIHRTIGRFITRVDEKLDYPDLTNAIILINVCESAYRTHTLFMLASSMP